MRDLKFRAYDKEKKSWITIGFHIIGEVTVFDMLKGYSIKDFNNIEVTQWTALKDKNGKEIYEGDILLKWNPKFAKEDRVIVDFSNGGFSFYSIEHNDDHDGSGRIDARVSEDLIIGNIYEKA